VRVYLDIETYSSVNLADCGVYKYVESDDFQILMCAISIDGGPVRVLLGDQLAEELVPLLFHDYTFVAHNAQFERVCFSRFLGMPTGKYLDPENWHDTQATAAEHGYPKKLENVARVLGGELKDDAGKRLVRLFCIPNRKGVRNLPEDHIDDWLDFIAYCAQDVVTLISIDEKLGDFPTPTERAVWCADQAVNDAGMAIDLEMAKRAVVASEGNRMLQELEVQSLTGVANPGSNPQMLAWLRSQGVELDNMQAATVAALLEDPFIDDTVRRVLELRQELALVAAKKYATAVASVCSDGRLRGNYRFFGAHTGRWSGSGVQLQNLPRAGFKYEVDQTMAILDLKAGQGATSQELKALVRALFVGPFTVVDYSSIEARVIAWLAGEKWALDAFADGRDIYVETAERMGGLTRAQGKVAVLALGYQGGTNSLRAMGAEGDDDELQKLVTQWRRANQKIMGLWSKVQDSISEHGPVGRYLRTSGRGQTLYMHLPSGRAITYHGVRWERYRVQDPKTGRMIVKEGWRYDNPERPGARIGTYGGRMSENITQAVARDIMAEAIVRLQEHGYVVVGHVHDEAIVQGNHDVAEIVKIMTESPTWATDMPINGEGFTCERYRKG